MTTQPAQPAQPDPAQAFAIVDRVGKLEGIATQANERFNDQTQEISALRVENHAEHLAFRAEIAELRTENHAEHLALRTEIAEQGKELRAEHQALRVEIAEQGKELRAEIAEQGKELRAEIAALRTAMHRQTYLVIAVLGGLVTLLRFVG